MVLDVRGARKLLGGRWVLDGLSLSWPGPGTLVVYGENGAGKSTFIKIVTGVLEQDEGEISIAGRSLSRERSAALAELGYVPDGLDLPAHLLVREFLALVSALKQRPLPESALLERLGVRGLLPERVSTLSLGQRRRVGLSAALIGAPRLLVLDEPTNGLDAEGQAILVALLDERRREGLAALVATHDRGFIEAAADVTMALEAGRLREMA